MSGGIMSYRLLTAAVAVLAAICVASPAPAAPPIPTLRAKADFRHLHIGTAVRAAPLATDATYPRYVSAQFNSVTPDGALEWNHVEPARGAYDWADADAILGLPVPERFGQPLVSHANLPAWLTGGAFSPAQLRDILRAHIRALVGRYAGRVQAWTVVYEPLAGDGGFWARALGPGYVADALRWAREADPAARLYLAEGGAEAVGPRSDALLALVRGLRAAGVPLDGVGLEGHFVLGEVPPSLQAGLARFGALGVEVRLTEVDVRVPSPATAESLAAQGTDYATVTAACRSTAACTGITTWGFTDKYTPVGGAWTALLLYTADYQPKPAYRGVLDTLIGLPDVEPPVRATLTAGTIGRDSVSLRAGGEDNNFVYASDLYREAGDPDVLVLSQVDNSLLTVAGLAPGTAYTFYVVLRDSAGNRSAPSAPLTVTTLP
jgi:endo-1,4-beta-xylanase